RSSPKSKQGMQELIASLAKEGKLVLEQGRGAVRMGTAEASALSHEMGKLGKLGGRPALPLEEKRGVASGAASNVRLKHQRPRRVDTPISVRSRVAQDMYRSRGAYASEDELVTAWSKRTGLPVRALRTWLADRESLEEEVKRHQQSQTMESRTHRSGKQIGVKASGLQQRVRKTGAGAKQKFPNILPKLQNWLRDEKTHGHQVLKKHLGWRWLIELQAEVSEKKKEMDRLGESEVGARVVLKTKVEEGEAMLRRHMKDEKAMQKRCDGLVKALGAKELRPNLTTHLSHVEQQVRALLSWQQHDYDQWRVAFGGQDMLEDLVAKPDEALKMREKAVLGFSDQIPLWAKKVPVKEVYAEHEVATAPQKEVREKTRSLLKEQVGMKKRGRQGRGGQVVKRAEDEPEVQEEGKLSLSMEDVVGEGGAGGLRHPTRKADAQADKMRITFEARQLVLNWFKPGAEPEGKVWKGLLIVPGQHARLDNISEKGEWKETESFEYRGQVRTHVKGQKVMSQPSSNVDAVIMAWSVREQAKSFPLTLWQRDSLAAAFSPDVVRQLRLGHQVQSIIAAKMTAQLQLTDTDFSAAFKALMRKEMGDLVWKGQEKLRRGGSGDIYKAQVEDICLALHHCMEEMMKRNEERWWVLKGLRRNGWLAVRPNLETSRMEWVEEEWAEGCRLARAGSLTDG
ncbi:unnamed protein product, partial [Effrenium voratum]